MNKDFTVIKYAILGNDFLMHQEFPQNTKIRLKYEWKDICCRVHKPFFGRGGEGLFSPKNVTA